MSVINTLDSQLRHLSQKANKGICSAGGLNQLLLHASLQAGIYLLLRLVTDALREFCRKCCMRCEELGHEFHHKTKKRNRPNPQIQDRQADGSFADLSESEDFA